jgi:hypothetical protein
MSVQEKFFGTLEGPWIKGLDKDEIFRGGFFGGEAAVT